MAQVLQDAGLFVGERLLPPHWSNPDGHFEDAEFVDLARSVLRENGCLDSGFVADVRISASTRLRREAEALVLRRRNLGIPWGWKDPRSVLLLELWKELLPDAHFVFMFRAPWEVMDSLFRRGDREIQTDPILALRSWMRYNAAILEFVRENPGRTSLFEVGQLRTGAASCVRCVAEGSGVNLTPARDCFRPELLTRIVDDARIMLSCSLNPDALRIFAELCVVSGSPESVRVAAPAAGPEAILHHAIGDWARTAAACSPDAKAEA